MKTVLHSIFIFAVLCTFCVNAQVTVEKKDSIWQLKVDGKPFPVKGVTFGHENDTANYNRYFKDMQLKMPNNFLFGLNRTLMAFLLRLVLD